MTHRTLSQTQELVSWCRDTRGVEWIALDTEFIAEKYYQPLLCLIQVGTPEGAFLLDPLAPMDTTPFWELLTEGEHETILHSGRVELEFCYRHTRKFPKKLFDTQLAAGLVTTDYPAGYSNLVFRFLGENLQNTESRTDWKCRPLTERQVVYALEDILYLHSLREILREELRCRGRETWMAAEMRLWQETVLALVSPQRWQRILGSYRYTPQELAIIRSLWQWREALAKNRNCSPRRVLRDDLLLELARRRVSEIRHIRSIRGMERGDLKDLLPDIANCIQKALELPESDCPQVRVSGNHTKLNVLGTLLSSVLGTIARNLQVAPSLVGSPSDVREWIAWKLQWKDCDETPILAQGWRAEMVGKIFEELLSGQKAIRIVQPQQECPLEFVTSGGHSSDEQ